jgi:serine protease Do
MAISIEHCSGRFLAWGLGALVLSACSLGASEAASSQVAAPSASAAAVTNAPLVSGLPDFTGLVQAYGPAVVNVRVEERRPERRGSQQEDMLRDRLRQFGFPFPDIPDAEPTPQRGTGSGFIVSPDGYILTNAHVVRDATEVTVKLIDRREFPAKVIGHDDKTDVAVIKIEGSKLPTVRIGDPSKLKVGQWVVAIGSPFGMENSVTAGIVSATTRALPNETFVPFIQTDVAVNPGNSGGPLFNLDGEVVGINSQIYSQSGGYMGLSFAIPIDMANSVREQLVSTGKVMRGRIGVILQEMNAGYAESFGLDRPRGALVADVVRGEPAEKAGIRPGDIILSVGGRPVENEVTLPSMVAAIKPGTNTEFELWSDRKLRKVTVKVAELNEDEAKASVLPGNRGDKGRSGGAGSGPEVLGMTVRPITAEEKQRLDTSGSLIVESVGGAAAKSGIQPGDIILGVQGVDVRTVAELQAAVARGTSNVVSVRVQRGEAVRFAQIRRESRS